MFGLRVTYLTGRVSASDFDDGDLKQQVEWPPHPSRLFSALVAAWGEGGGERELLPALAWLEDHPVPSVYAGDATQRTVLPVFVPVNDVSSIPESRPRKPRRFPSAGLAQPDVYFVWPEAPTVEMQRNLDIILNRTSSLGHSSSLVAIEIVQELPSDHLLRHWQPGGPAGKPRRLRVAYPGRLSELEQSHQRFVANPSKTNRPTAGRSILYGQPAKQEAGMARSVLGEMIVLRRLSGPRVTLSSSYALLSALRGAILHHAPQPVPEYLSGHAPGSTMASPMPAIRPHLALIPLAFTSSPHASGEVMGVAALLPRSLSSSERYVCWEVLGKIAELRMGWGVWQVELADAEEHRLTLQEETWTGPSDVWATITPFVFDRFPKDPYGDEAQEVVRTAFARAGLPEPAEIDLHYNPWHRGVPKASLFKPAPARPGKPQRYHCHVWARFAEPIQGPIVAGAGRHYGYGLFRPITTGSAE